MSKAASADDLPAPLGAEQATIYLFFRPDSSMERSFFTDLQKLTTGHPVTLRGVEVKSTDEPLAKKFAVTETPLALVYDRRGRQTGKATNTDEIVKLAMQASDVGRIDWAMPGSPQADEIQKRMGLSDVRRLPGIMRAMSFRPEAMLGMISMANLMHFKDGELKVRTKEMIATYVSSLNQCKFCLSSHAGFLSKAGQDGKDIDALWLRDPKKAIGLAPKDVALLEYVKRLTEEPWKITDSDIESLRKAGWTDPELYEATFDAALFAFFNRMANAYGLDYAASGWPRPAGAKY
ncbi:carboxymuconolactone decarboxylase family protein [Armatimonas rosea]|uniref:Putative peroxidase-related enzyme n=1 Tax=Armatimonas rosea TaxID=685828 RepID=A0A7W9W5Z7_ARMRO|nr:peroxidase-related enzyme [Armatimonas rosea]MBB6049591.1 putative peroxidase-related enzyme [Armatimonas rosea]